MKSHILQYNNSGPVYDRYSKQKKLKSPFSTTPLSSNATSPVNSRKYLHKPYVARNYLKLLSLGCIFAADNIQILVVGSSGHVCNVTERIMAVQHQFMVNLSNAHMRLAVDDQ